MNQRRLLSATFWAMILVQTVASIDLPGTTSTPHSGSWRPGQLPRKLPSPKQYVAIVVLWSILNLIADAGPSYARLAARLSFLVLLTGAVVGPFGQRAVGFLNFVSTTFRIRPRHGDPGRRGVRLRPAAPDHARSVTP